MQAIFGICGKDFAIVAADKHEQFSIVRLKDDEDKIKVVDGNKLFAVAGPNGDTAQFMEFIEKNIVLYKMRNGIKLGTAAAANFTRNELAHALRRGPYQVDMLIAGYDEDEGPSLYFMDYLSSMQKLNKAAILIRRLFTKISFNMDPCSLFDAVGDLLIPSIPCCLW